MPGDDALTAAIEELYSLRPEAFTNRRGALATKARQDGDPKSARAITALRRPTRAAWIVNRLAWAEPEVVARLAELGAQLRDAQRSLDGTRLRQLTQQRRKLIDAATRQAFDLSGQDEPPASLRHEVASTLEAALADPDVAEQFGAGTLLRCAQWSGFGDPVPTLSAVPTPQAERRPAKTPTHTKRNAATKPAGNASAAQEALEVANAELRSATDAEREQDKNVALVTEQLADARRRLDEARLHTRQANARLRDAQRRRDRTRH